MRQERALTLRGAFALALLLHVVALAVLAYLPWAEARENSLERIQVFGTSAHVLGTPVSLIALETPEKPIPAPTVEVLPKPQLGVIERVKPNPHGAAVPAPISRMSRAHTTPTRRGSGSSRPAGGNPGGPPASGGRGPIILGSSSSGGTIPMPTGDSGGAPGGVVPGNGQGSGTGTGDGSGSPSGPGNGTGVGSSGEGNGEHGGGQVAPPASPTPPPVDQEEPKLLSKGKLTYPLAAAAAGVEGKCILKVLVGEKGEVQEVKVTTSSGDARLDDAAKAYVRKWKYRPAVQNGHPQAVYTKAIVEFVLD